MTIITQQPRPVVRRTRKQVLKLWVKALRSGEYEQTKGALRSQVTHAVGPRFCCLGVLCDLAARDGGKEWDAVKVSNYDGGVGAPPAHVTEFLGLTRMDVETFIFMNDENSKSFSEIADYIEKKFLEA